jgi:DNA-binding GntR family transcriptional regulator
MSNPGASAPQIDPDGEIAPYLQLASILRDQIRTGQLKAGDRLPSIIDLSERYGIARTTAHKGLRVLVDEGLAVVSRGRGMFVKRS